MSRVEALLASSPDRTTPAPVGTIGAGHRGGAERAHSNAQAVHHRRLWQAEQDGSLPRAAGPAAVHDAGGRGGRRARALPTVRRGGAPGLPRSGHQRALRVLRAPLRRQ
eukprot:4147077-Pyramimonas_sp.AAC.1